MIVARTVEEVRRWSSGRGGDLGLVPTMGFLHEGHLTLVRRARDENARVAVSLFVNPTQFGPHEDLARYPRDEANDRRLLQDAGCDFLFAPDVAEMYPPGATTVVDTGAVSGPLEGERRPGHFRGVATIVLKLLNAVQPTRAYFGEKDAQQLAVVRRMVADLDLPVAIVGCPTVREADGLAMSSRNSYLKPEERAAAPVLYRALQEARAAAAAGQRSGEVLRAGLRARIEAEPLARVDYVSVSDPATFRELDRLEGPALALLAVRFGTTRLIDNLRLDA